MRYIASFNEYDYYWNEETCEVIHEYDPWYNVIGCASSMDEARNVVDDY